MSKLSPQRKATFVSSFTAFSLMIMKFFVWIFSGSIAVLSSAIDSMMDLFVSMFNNFAIFLSEKRPNKNFNYWRWKIEAMASFIEWLIIILSAIFIFYKSIDNIINKEVVMHIWVSLIVMLISVLATLFLVLYLNKIAKQTDNLVIQSDALHYKTDLLSNWWILISLLIIKFTGFHLIDSIIWILVAIYIVTEAYELVKKWFLLLLDVSLNEKEVEQIENIINKQERVQKFYNLKTRQSGNIKFVEVNVMVSECMILMEADMISHEIEAEIKEIDPRYEWNVVIHMDPYNTKS